MGPIHQPAGLVLGDQSKHLLWLRAARFADELVSLLACRQSECRLHGFIRHAAVDRQQSAGRKRRPEASRGPNKRITQKAEEEEFT